MSVLINLVVGNFYLYVVSISVVITQGALFLIFGPKFRSSSSISSRYSFMPKI
jgi:hypothetical protein